MSLSTFHSIALVQNSGRGMVVETYSTRIAVVLGVLNSGSVASGIYGGEGHVAALDAIEKHIAGLREQIKIHNENDGNAMTED